MIVRCVDFPSRYKGLTIGKSYEAQALVVESDDGVMRVRFLIFNDQAHWGTYPADLFVPVNHERL